MLPTMYRKRDTTLWEYRRRKRRILSPVARGLIVGALLCTWILYYYIFRQEPELGNEFIDSSVNQFEISSGKGNAKGNFYEDDEYRTPPSLNNVNTEEWFHNLKTAFEASSSSETKNTMSQHFEILHRSGKCKNDFLI